MSVENKLYIEYPAGGGGRWLTNLIFNLENSIEPNTNVLKNYHNEKQSANVVLCHRLNEPVDSHIKFGGPYSFNFYINFLIKTDYITRGSFNFFKAEASNKLIRQMDHPDLGYQLLNSPTLFADQLFKILDSNNFSYNKNYSLVERSIELYKNSCPIVEHYIDNANEKVWQAWAQVAQELHGLKSITEFTINRFIKLKNTP